MKRRDKHVSVDLEPEQKGEVQRLANASGMTVAGWLRATVILAIKRRATFRIEYVES